jgi:sugar phosphate isomerase/epimerase
MRKIKFAIVVPTPEVKVNSLGLKGNFEENIKKIADLGYNGVELFVGNPNKVLFSYINTCIQNNGLQVSAIGTGLTCIQYGLSFTSPTLEIRKKAVNRIKEYIRLARKFKSNIIIGSVIGKYQTDYEKSLNSIRECLVECAKLAAELDVTLLLEPLNRYESTIINTLSEAVDLIKEINTECIKVMGDTFHMNIEEKSIYEAIKDAREYFKYIHLADSNRKAPGFGHLNFDKIFNTLKEIGYSDFASAEILTLPDQDTAVKSTIEHLKLL